MHVSVRVCDASSALRARPPAALVYRRKQYVFRFAVQSAPACYALTFAVDDTLATILQEERPDAKGVALQAARRPLYVGAASVRFVADSVWSLSVQVVGGVAAAAAQRAPVPPHAASRAQVRFCLPCFHSQLTHCCSQAAQHRLAARHDAHRGRRPATRLHVRRRLCCC